MNQPKRSAVEQMIASAQTKVSWGRAVARANAGLSGKPRVALRQPQDRPRAGWQKVVARINARLG